MRLTRLEAKGFKSFGDKIILHFGAGVTGVVGPNGCGKSNIVDAIRWVLGEQKIKNLRSDKMENIIFNGTANRKPLQYAEVQLTFENDRGILPSEYGQVSIGRRYFRSGDSEYEINGVRCRLKDIENLFLDTGIGSDSYAIIELKMVDDILNDREGSRRLLFEEAAGISKFKVRRKETFRRLADVKADLERVEDLLHEITRNLKNLEKQARQAERYFELKKSHKHLSLWVARSEYTKRSAAASKIAQQSAELVAQAADLLTSMATGETQLTTLKAEVVYGENEFGSRQKAYLDLQDQIRQIENQRKLSNERQRSLQQRKDLLTNQLNGDRSQLLLAQSLISKLEEDEKRLAEEASSAGSALSGLKTELELRQKAFAVLQQQVSEADSHLRIAQEGLQKLLREEQIAQAQMGTFAAEQQRLLEKKEQQTTDFSTFDQKLKELDAQLGDAAGKLERTEKAEAARASEEATLVHTADGLRDEIAKLARKRDALQNEYNLTKSLQDNLEGYPEAIRYLRKNTGWSNLAEVPLVSDIITVPEAYRIALEYFLEPVMNHYVVETASEAMKAVEILAKSSKGKASFFVLSQIGAMPAADLDFKALPEGAISALSVAEFDLAFEPLVRHLLANVLFVESPTAVAHTDFILLATDGHLIRRTATIAGGSVGLYEGKRIGRAKNLEKLQTDLIALAKQLKELEARQEQAIKQLATVKSQDQRQYLDQLRRAQAVLEQDATAWRVRRQNALQALEDQGSRLSTIANTLAELQAALGTIGPEKATMEAEQLRWKERHAALNLERQQAEAEQSTARETLNVKQMASVRLVGQNEQTTKELAFRREDIDKLLARIAKNEADLAGAELELGDVLGTETTGDADLQALYAELKAIDAGVKESGNGLHLRKEAVEAQEKSLRELARRKDQNQTLAAEMGAQLSALNAKLEAAAERILVEYGIDLTVIKQVSGEELEGLEADLAAAPDGEEESWPATAAQLREQLDKMGPINPVAMESYKEMKERFDFIEGQKKDLAQAQADLGTTIAEIEATAQEAFLATFEAVRGHFHTVFRSLFSAEDTCDLVLAQPAQPLESAIEIMARPKGKRPLTINQLSGGEKTLTAIALLFSIYLIKPAPFCIFDEVDAPLDDNNIDKFNNIIRDFSGNSQFIVVTHNKRTMTHADVLYGITMVEQGISRVIPVDLREVVENGK